MGRLTMLSATREQDLAYLALKDLADVIGELSLDCRVVGGNAVSLLVAAYDVQGVPTRDTVDANVAAAFEVLSHPGLLTAMTDRGYVRDDGSRCSRALREDERQHFGTGDHALDALRPMVDFMGPSFDGRHRANQPAGDLTVDAFPGLGLVLAQPPVLVTIDVRLTSAMTFTIDLPLPSPKSELCVKLLSYRDRGTRKDAVDIWRLLGVCHAAGVRPDDWQTRGAQGDALRVLTRFVILGSRDLEAASTRSSDQARIRALARSVAP